MTRLAVAFDRVVVLLVGGALVAAAVLTVAWQRGAIGGGGRLRMVFLDVMTAPWWPWASAAFGVLLILVGLRWLLAHRGPAKANSVVLAGDESALSANAAAAARAAAERLSLQHNVIKATGAAAIEHGHPVVTLNVTVPSRGGLPRISDDVDDVARTLDSMLGGAVDVRGVVSVKTVKRAVR